MEVETALLPPPPKPLHIEWQGNLNARMMPEGIASAALCTLTPWGICAFLVYNSQLDETQLPN